jgi:Xaa-Pro aminopeptidase
MRLIKDADEVKALQSAVSATKRGFEDVIGRLKTAASERELEGVFWTRARCGIFLNRSLRRTCVHAALEEE